LNRIITSWIDSIVHNIKIRVVMRVESIQGIFGSLQRIPVEDWIDSNNFESNQHFEKQLWIYSKYFDSIQMKRIRKTLIWIKTFHDKFESIQMQFSWAKHLRISINRFNIYMNQLKPLKNSFWTIFHEPNIQELECNMWIKSNH